MKKRFVFCVLIIFLLSFLASCGSSETSAPPAVDEPSESYSAPASDVPAAAPADNGLESSSAPETDESFDGPFQEEPDIQPTSTPRIDFDELFSEHSVDFEDPEGYTIRETVKISPIFKDGDMDTFYDLWQYLGGTADEVPGLEESFIWNSQSEDHKQQQQYNRIYYVAGTFSLENLTEGFPISADNPRSYMAGLGYPTATNLDINVYGQIGWFNCMVFYSNEVGKYDWNTAQYFKNTIYFGNPKMVKDAFGPVRFLVMLPDTVSPKYPNGHYADSLELTVKLGKILDGSTSKFTLTTYSG